MAGRKRESAKKRHGRTPRRSGGAPVGLRIIGGRFRGRKLDYSGDPRVRPMKDRVREAVFNLVGPSVQGKHAVDLFAGTGALGLEAISRGAERATLIEQHVPTAAVIRRNVARLEVESLSDVVTANVFFWAGQPPELGAAPWLVFSSPPFDFYVDRAGEMLDLLGRLIERAPAESIFVVESDGRFDPARLPEPGAWDVRSYPPAVVAIYRKPAAT
ncbi:MAG TPA: RsmD family RNA methyltransferase [Thermoguttaceae bacterium]|nr:RsmD family RNA methyltransferase [Thermoguttaceae bacterium]